MLFASPKGFFQSRYELSNHGDRRVGLIDLNYSSEGSEITIGSSNYLAHAHGVLEREYILETFRHEPVGRASTTLLSGRFDLHFGDKVYLLKTESGFSGPSFMFYDGADVKGNIHSEGFFKRKYVIDLPEVVPIQFHAFLAWMVITMVKRSSSV